MLLNVAFSELKMKKGKVVLTNRGSIIDDFVDYELLADLTSAPLYNEIMDTKVFKRLQDISFLGAIDYTSHNKKRHNRYNHSISVGTLALYYATLMQLSDYESRHLVLAALLHDIGHGPLSHSMEPAFQKRYGISHHSISNDIIKGESKLGKELYLILKKYYVNVEYIIALLDGEVSNKASFALNNPINIDTADGIIRTISYAYPPKSKKSHLALLPKPKDIIEALITKNKKVLDEFWTLKHRAYNAIIHKPENLKADVVALDFAKSNKMITRDDFYLTDKMFKKKYGSMFEKIISEKIEAVEYKKRFYFLSTQKTQIDSNEDFYTIYQSKKEANMLPTFYHAQPKYQPTLFEDSMWH